MFVDHLQLADFRSYAGGRRRAGGRGRVFVGANGQGKTNLVEAVEYLSTLSSHRVAADQPLVRAGAERAIVRARVHGRAGRPAAAAARGGDHPRPGQPRPAQPVAAEAAAGAARHPPHGALRAGGPGRRQGRPERAPPLPRRADRGPLAAAGRDPGRLRPGAPAAQHPAQVAGRPVCAAARAGADVGSTLDVWDSHLAAAGGELLAARLRTLADLAPHVAKAYADIAPTNNDATVEYKASVDLAALRQAQGAETREELTELLSATMLERRPRGDPARRLPGRAAPRRPGPRPGPAAGQGVRQPRRVVVVRAGPEAGQLRAAPRRRGRAGADPGRRVRRARHHPPGAAGRRGERRRAGAGHRRGRRRRPRAAAGPPLHRGRRRGDPG